MSAAQETAAAQRYVLACGRHKRARRNFCGRFRKTSEFVGVCLQVIEKALELQLHRVHFFPHVEDDFDAREIDAEIARQRENYFEAFEVCVRVKPRVSFGARGRQESFAFIKSERLRVNIVFARHSADRICANFLFHNFRSQESGVRSRN